MKKIIASLLIASIVLMGCGHPGDFQSPSTGKMKEYPTYGFFNADSSKSAEMCYEVSVGNVVWSIILVETIIMPVYFIGFSIFNPIGPKVDGKCGIDQY